MHLSLTQQVEQTRGLWLKFRFRLFYKSTKKFQYHCTNVGTKKEPRPDGPQLLLISC